MKDSKTGLMNRNVRKKVYFRRCTGFSFHTDRGRRSEAVPWLDEVKSQSTCWVIFSPLVRVQAVPKGFTPAGQNGEVTDSGVEVHFFVGNHDLWLTDYLTEECGTSFTLNHLLPIYWEVVLPGARRWVGILPARFASYEGYSTASSCENVFRPSTPGGPFPSRTPGRATAARMGASSLTWAKRGSA